VTRVWKIDWANSLMDHLSKRHLWSEESMITGEISWNHGLLPGRQNLYRYLGDLTKEAQVKTMRNRRSSRGSCSGT